MIKYVAAVLSGTLFLSGYFAFQTTKNRRRYYSATVLLGAIYCTTLLSWNYVGRYGNSKPSVVEFLVLVPGGPFLGLFAGTLIVLLFRGQGETNTGAIGLAIGTLIVLLDASLLFGVLPLPFTVKYPF